MLPEPYYQNEHCTIYCADNREILPFLGRFDLLLTDPPYGIGEKLGPRKRTDPNQWAKHFNAGAPEWDKEPVPLYVLETAISITDEAIVWGGQFYELPPKRCWLMWNKIVRNWSSSEYELAWTTLDKPNRAFDYSHGQLATEGKTFHPTQKPLPLMRWCLGLVPDAKTILDPWLGSGTTLVASLLEGRKSVGIEINEQYCEVAVQRIEKALRDDSYALISAKTLNAQKSKPAKFEETPKLF